MGERKPDEQEHEQGPLGLEQVLPTVSGDKPADHEQYPERADGRKQELQVFIDLPDILFGKGVGCYRQKEYDSAPDGIKERVRHTKPLLHSDSIP